MHLAPFLDQQSVLEQKNGPLRYISICICMKLISKIFLKICFTFSNKECGLPPESHRPTVPAAQRHRPPSPPTDCNYWIIIIIILTIIITRPKPPLGRQGLEGSVLRVNLKIYILCLSVYNEKWALSHFVKVGIRLAPREWKK